MSETSCVSGPDGWPVQALWSSQSTRGRPIQPGFGWAGILIWLLRGEDELRARERLPPFIPFPRIVASEEESRQSER